MLNPVNESLSDLNCGCDLQHGEIIFAFWNAIQIENYLNEKERLLHLFSLEGKKPNPDFRHLF